MIHVVLVEPRSRPIPAMSSACAPTPARRTLHLVRLDNRSTTPACVAPGSTITNTPCRCTTTGRPARPRSRRRGDALVRHRDLRRPLAHETVLQHNDAFVFGSGTRGLSATVLADFARAATAWLPMRPAIRSLNLSNAVAVTVYEAWRQLGFEGAG